MSPLARPAALALLLAVAGPALAATGKATIEDDYARARAEARRRGVPMVIDVWAPW